MKHILWICMEYLNDLKPEISSDYSRIVLLLHVLVSYTSTNQWGIFTKRKDMEVLRPGMNQMCYNIMGELFQKGYYRIIKQVLLKGLCRNRVPFTHAALAAVLSLSLRPLVAANFSDKLMTMYLIHILSTPGLIKYCCQLSDEVSMKIFM